METPLQITFRHMSASAPLENDIRDRARSLEHHFGRLSSCHVTVDAPSDHHRKGSEFRVAIIVRLPRHELVSSPEHQAHHEHEDAYVAVRDGFLAIRRQLDDEIRRTRSKVHASPRLVP